MDKDTCKGRCGDVAPSGCGCDVQCKAFGDCCADFGSECSSIGYRAKDAQDRVFAASEATSPRQAVNVPAYAPLFNVISTSSPGSCAAYCGKIGPAPMSVRPTVTGQTAQTNDEKSADSKLQEEYNQWVRDTLMRRTQDAYSEQVLCYVRFIVDNSTFIFDNST